MTTEEPLLAEDPTKQELAPPALPDYVLSPNAVFNDHNAQWRYGQAPDYSKTRRVWEEGRKNHHAAGSLEQIVENLVKNWEVEASFKPRLEDWRTIDQSKYTFAMSGGAPQSASHMLKVGTYNAIIAPNEYYDPNQSDFASSHKTFKRMMPTFAWEVMEVYSGPPKVVFKWRHWGEMKNDYVGFNNKGQKVTAKAHGGPIEIFGTTVAVVDDQLRVISLDTYMDSLDMFRQIAPHGVVNAEPKNHKVPLSEALGADAPHNDGVKIAQAHEQAGAGGEEQKAAGPEDITGKHLSSSTGQAADAYVPNQGACPFGGSNGMEGVEAPHPIPQSPQHANAMNVDQPSADIHTSDMSRSGTEGRAPEGLPTMVTETQGEAVPDDVGEAGATQSASKRPATAEAEEQLPASIYSSAVTGDMTNPIKTARRSSFVDESTATGARDAVDTFLEQPAEVVHPQSKDVEEAVQPDVGEAVIASVDAPETKEAKKEMSEVKPAEEALIMNRE